MNRTELLLLVTFRDGTKRQVRVMDYNSKVAILNAKVRSGEWQDYEVI